MVSDRFRAIRLSQVTSIALRSRSFKCDPFVYRLSSGDRRNNNGYGDR